ncbi:MAG: xanthine dehydrogenase molybdopterin binding subunit [Pseudomonadales bacterium]|nr:xanthine dehydrogenase molybdopterin binding subunit [Pseudomonadales bacterium]
MKTETQNSHIGETLGHDSAILHVRGSARFTDDIREPRDILHAAIGLSEYAHATLVQVDLEKVRQAPGVIAVITAKDIPGANNFGAVLADDPILADTLVEYHGQAIFAVAATSANAARKAVLSASINYQDLPAILTARAAAEAHSYILPTEKLDSGDSQSAIDSACHQLSGEVNLGGQDQFYMEGQIAIATPEEQGAMQIYSSTQHPSEVQHIVAQALNIQSKDVTIICRRMGGGFGGKESQPSQFAALAAILAQKTKRPVKLRLDRDTDMRVTGKRHDFNIRYTVGFDKLGLIEGIEFKFSARCGMSADLSGAINDRTMFHCDNAYYLPNISIQSYRCKTNTVSNTAFRGFGGPQGMFAIEYVIDEIARYLNKDPLSIRRKNFYGIKNRNITPYQQKIRDNVIWRIVSELQTTSDYQQRKQDIAEFNANSRFQKRGIALTPVKFGISFTALHLNQAGALVHIYQDGSIHLNHGGTEMGQGLFTKVAQVVAEEFQVRPDLIKITATDTSKVPNTSATAASSGSDLNGKAAQQAALIIKARLIDFAADKYDIHTSEVIFKDSRVYIGDQSLPFEDLINQAYMARISLSSTGFYRTPKIHFDRTTFTGNPFYYFSYGAAVSEVLVDTLTGEHRLLRTDILHDCGNSLNPALDIGQIEGGFMQGVGWLTSEELCFSDQGELETHAPSTYKVPLCSDTPEDFRVNILRHNPNKENTIYRSKAVGEPPLMLGLSVFFAIKDAISSIANSALQAPATPESVLNTIKQNHLS